MARRMTEFQNIAYSWLTNHFECRPIRNILSRHTMIRHEGENKYIDAGPHQRWRIFDWAGRLRNALDKTELLTNEEGINTRQDWDATRQDWDALVRSAYDNPKEYQINLYPHIIANAGPNVTRESLARVRAIRRYDTRVFALPRYKCWKYLAPAIQYVEDLKQYGIIASSVLYDHIQDDMDDFAFSVAIHPVHNPDILNPNWKTTTVVNLCRQLVEFTKKGVLKWLPLENRQEIYPILADALADAGCTNEFWLRDLQSSESTFGEYIVLHTISDLIFIPK